MKGLEERGGSPLTANPEFGAFLSKQVFETKLNQLASELSKGDFEYLSSIMKVPILREPLRLIPDPEIDWIGTPFDIEIE